MGAGVSLPLEAVLPGDDIRLSVVSVSLTKEYVSICERNFSGGGLTTRGRSHQKWISLPQKRKAVLMGLEALAPDPSVYRILCLDPHEGVKALSMEVKPDITMPMPSSVSENGSPDPVGGGKASALAARRQGDKVVLMAETSDVTFLLPVSSATVAHSVGERLVKHGLDGQVSRSTYHCSLCSGPERPFCFDQPEYYGQSRDREFLGLVLPPIQADLVCEGCPARARSDPWASILPVFVMPIACVQKLEFLSLTQKRGTDLLPASHRVTVSSDVHATNVGNADFSNCGAAVHAENGTADANDSSNAGPDGYTPDRQQKSDQFRWIFQKEQFLHAVGGCTGSDIGPFFHVVGGVSGSGNRDHGERIFVFFSLGFSDVPSSVQICGPDSVGSPDLLPVTITLDGGMQGMTETANGFDILTDGQVLSAMGLPIPCWSILSRNCHYLWFDQ